MSLKYLGGVFGGNIKPTPFICLVLKMLQIQPEKDIVVEFITQQDFKSVLEVVSDHLIIIELHMGDSRFLTILGEAKKLTLITSSLLTQ